MAERPQAQPEGDVPKETGVRADVVEHLRGVIAQTGGKVDVTDPRYVAVHGTSAQTLRVLLERGRIPGVTHIDPFTSYEPGDVSVIPTPEMDVPDTLRTELITVFQADPREVASYGRINASNIAQRHEFLSRMGRPLTSRLEGTFAYASIDREDDPGETVDSDEYFRQTGATQEEIITAAEAARSKKGFLLGISHSASADDRLRVMEGDPDTYDLRFRSVDGKGLPFEHIAGIEPLGPEERKFLEDMGIPVPQEDTPGVSELRTSGPQVAVFVEQTAPVDRYLGTGVQDQIVFQRYGLKDTVTPEPQKEVKQAHEVDE